jgi:hypothetical protein
VSPSSESSSTTVETYEDVTDRLANQIIDEETKHEIEQHRHDLEHPEEEQQRHQSHDSSHHSSHEHHVGVNGNGHHETANHPYSTSEIVSHLNDHDQLSSSTTAGEGSALILPTVPAESIFRQQHTNEAVGEVLTNVSRNSIVLRKELEYILLKDIHTMDEHSLRIRKNTISCRII